MTGTERTSLVHNQLTDLLRMMDRAVVENEHTSWPRVWVCKRDLEEYSYYVRNTELRKKQGDMDGEENKGSFK